MTAKGVWHACHRHRWMYVYFINLPQTWREGRGGTKGRREKEEKKLNALCKLWPANIRYHTTWNASIYPKHFRQHANLYSLGRLFFKRFPLFRACGATSSACSPPPQSGGVSDRHFALCLTVTHCVPICFTTEARLWWQRWEQTEYEHDGDSFSHNVSSVPFTQGNEARFVVRILATDHDFSRDNSCVERSHSCITCSSCQTSSMTQPLSIDQKKPASLITGRACNWHPATHGTPCLDTSQPCSAPYWRWLLSWQDST